MALFTESALEQSIMTLFEQQEYTPLNGELLERVYCKKNMGRFREFFCLLLPLAESGTLVYYLFCAHNILCLINTTNKTRGYPGFSKESRGS